MPTIPKKVSKKQKFKPKKRIPNVTANELKDLINLLGYDVEESAEIARLAKEKVTLLKLELFYMLPMEKQKSSLPNEIQNLKGASLHLEEFLVEYRRAPFVFKRRLLVRQNPYLSRAGLSAAISGKYLNDFIDWDVFCREYESDPLVAGGFNFDHFIRQAEFYSKVLREKIEYLAKQKSKLKPGKVAGNLPLLIENAGLIFDRYHCYIDSSEEGLFEAKEHFLREYLKHLDITYGKHHRRYLKKPSQIKKISLLKSRKKHK